MVFNRALVDVGISEIISFLLSSDATALVRSEEAAMVLGLLVSLNVVDCNLCIKVHGQTKETLKVT